MMKKSNVANIAIYGIIIFICLLMVMPFYWMVRSAILDQSQVFKMPPVWIPTRINVQNFKDAFSALPFGRYYLNTIIITALSILGVVITASLSAYSFSRLKWYGRDKIFAVIISTMMLPSFVTLIPTFLGWKAVGALNTYIPLILPSWFGGGAFSIFLLRQFYLSIPKELEEAAYIDGASHFRIFSQIIVPLTKPALLVVALFQFLASWNDYLSPTVYLNDTAKFTLSIGLKLFTGMYNSQWNLMMAAATVISLPPIIVFIVCQKYFIEGVSFSGIKG